MSKLRNDVERLSRRVQPKPWAGGFVPCNAEERPVLLSPGGHTAKREILTRYGIPPAADLDNLVQIGGNVYAQASSRECIKVGERVLYL